MRHIHSLSKLSVLCGLLFLSSCIFDIPQEPFPSTFPTFSPTPPVGVSATPFIPVESTPTPSPQLDPVKLFLTPFTSVFEIIQPLYKIEFGPGTKGPQLEFGPGTKGPQSEFGPGTKGPTQEFGPGTKGPENLRFNLVLPATVLRPNLADFTLKQVGLSNKINRVLIELIHENQVYALVSVLPKEERIQFSAPVHPITYTVKVKTLFENALSDSFWTKLTVKPETYSEIKVELHPGRFKPEDYDIELLTRNNIQP